MFYCKRGGERVKEGEREGERGRERTKEGERGRERGREKVPKGLVRCDVGVYQVKPPKTYCGLRTVSVCEGPS